MTPEEIDRRIRQNPMRFATEMEARGRHDLKDPAFEFGGRLLIGAAQRLRATSTAPRHRESPRRPCSRPGWGSELRRSGLPGPSCRHAPGTIDTFG